MLPGTRQRDLKKSTYGADKRRLYLIYTSWYLRLFKSQENDYFGIYRTWGGVGVFSGAQPAWYITHGCKFCIFHGRKSSEWMLEMYLQVENDVEEGLAGFQGCR